MMVKVHGGTPLQEGHTLCDTCANSHIVRGRRMEEELVMCEAMGHMRPLQITFKVTQCSGYLDQRVPPFQELLEKAWILRPATKRRPAGFVRAADLTDEEARRLFSESDD